MCVTCEYTKEYALRFNKTYFGHIIETDSPRKTAIHMTHHFYGRGYGVNVIQNPASVELQLYGDVSCKDVRNRYLAALILDKCNEAFSSRIDNTLYYRLGVNKERLMPWINENLSDIAPYVVLTNGEGCVTITVNGEIV